MVRIALFKKAGDVRIDPARRGHHVVYRAQESNRCPSCGRANWYVGRMTAECGFCGTAVALAEVNLSATGRAAVRVLKPAATEADEAAAERRRHGRVKAAGRNLELLIDGSPHSFALENVSDGGLMGSNPAGLKPKARLHVRFDEGIVVPATVTWVDGDLIGLALSSPVGRKLTQTSH